MSVFAPIGWHDVAIKAGVFTTTLAVWNDPVCLVCVPFDKVLRLTRDGQRAGAPCPEDDVAIRTRCRKHESDRCYTKSLRILCATVPYVLSMQILEERIVDAMFGHDPGGDVDVTTGQGTSCKRIKITTIAPRPRWRRPAAAIPNRSTNTS